jgi:two-component system sensor histidine kinase KdpD
VLERIKIQKQYIVSLSLIGVLSFACYVAKDFIDYRIVALLLLLAVSTLAILFDIIPVMISAFLSALALNIFFIDPVLHYKINNPENALLFFIYLSVALVNAVLTNRIRRQEQKIRHKEEKEKNIKLYNTLLNSLSHELKTPVATIIGVIDTLKVHDDTLSSGLRNELIAELETAGIRLSRQVNNLLDMSRLETGNLQLKKDWCDVNELVFLTLRKFPDTNGHTITFNPGEELPLFKIDEGLIEQVLYGLIHNAIIHTKPGSAIRIAAISDTDKLKITVSDNGQGFPETETEKVFDIFYRLPHTQTGGTGLGLSIAKGFVEAHDGVISLENKPGGGAIFTIVIPAETSYLKNLKNE